MAIRFEPKTPEAQKPKPDEAAPAAPNGSDLQAERAKPSKAKGKTAARGDRAAKAEEGSE